MVSAERRNCSAIRSIRDLLQYRARMVSPLIRFVEMSRLLKQAEFEDLLDRFRETLVIFEKSFAAIARVIARRGTME